MESLEGITALLTIRGRRDLGNLLSKARVEFLTVDEGFTLNQWNMVTIVKAQLVAPISDYDRLIGLSDEDNDVILGALQEIWPYEEQEGDMMITRIGYRLDPDSLLEESKEVNPLLQLLTSLRHIMVDVSTGGRLINEVNPEFKELYSQLASGLTAMGLRNPIPYSDLWDWYGKWSSGDLPTYRSR